MPSRSIFPLQAQPSQRLAAAPIQGDSEPEPYVAHDVQLGQIFTNMRVAMMVSRNTIARRLATTTFIVEMLETGTVASFPHWRETARIVRGYCELLRLDPEPILWRIRSHYHASGLPMGLVAEETTSPQTTQARTGQGQSATVTRRGQASASRSGRRRGRFLVLTAPVVLAAGVLIAAQGAPEPVYAAIHVLPLRLETPLLHAFNELVHVMAPTREGLRWVEIDPQLRKGDKLPMGKR